MFFETDDFDSLERQNQMRVINFTGSVFSRVSERIRPSDEHPASGTARAPVPGVTSAAWNQSTHATRSRERAQARFEADLRQGPIVLSLFFLIQLLDGALTYWGVTRFGIDLEMNALLSGWMHEIGPATTLLVAKMIACGCGLILYRAKYLRPLAAVAGLCLGVAVVPWAFLMASIY
jgi:hypothetical protein